MSSQTDSEANLDEALLAHNEHSPEEAHEHEHPHPRGALMVGLIYLVVLIAFWGYMYALLFLRGG